jgi:hypothetical protein
MNIFNKPPAKIQDDQQLTSDEIELVLKILGDTMFPVKQIEILYKALWKLQMQHQNQIKISNK